jgi:predicted small lipoprotein YifL
MRRALTAGLVLALLLAACGQKGPLYLPDKKPAAVTPPAAAPAAAPAATPATPAPAQPTQKKSDDQDSDSQPPK